MKRRTPTEGNIWKTYAFQVLYQSDSFYFPVVSLLWLANGLSLFKIALLQAIFSILLFICDLPSGYLADQLGRKRSLLFGGMFLTLGAGVYILASSFGQFLIAELLLAIGFAFISGADSAMLYDSLDSEGKVADYQRLWGKAGFYRLTGTALFNIVGAFAATSHLRTPFYFAFVGMLLLIPLALSFVEPSQKKKREVTGHLANFVGILKLSLKENTRLRWMLVSSSIIYAFTLVILWFYQPYFKLIGLPVAYFGLIFASFQAVAAIAARFAHRLNEIFGKRWLLIILIGLVAANYLLIGNFVLPFSFLFMYLLQISRGIQQAVLSDYVNNETTSDVRATVLSIQSSMGTVLYTIVLLVFGAVADHIGLPQTFSLAGIVLLVLGGLSLIPLIKNKVI